MPKRFTDTDKWKKPFIRSLPVEYKLFWLYILDDCDHAGIWQVDIEIANLKLGVKVSLEKARGLFGERVVVFDAETKWFIPDFIEFQYGHLTESNKMYKPISLLLNRYNLMGHLSPINGVIVQVKEKVQVKDRGGAGEILYPIETCLTISLSDERYIRANKTNHEELKKFNDYLEKQGVYEINPLDYKRYFAKLKGKYPDLIKAKLTADDYRRLIEEKEKQRA